MPPNFKREMTALFAHPLTSSEPDETLPVDMSYTGPKSAKKTPEEIQKDYMHQVGADWKRNGGSTYFISGVNALALNEYKTLDSWEKVKALFEKTLLTEFEGAEQDAFFSLLIPHIHQGGLIHNAATRLRERYCIDAHGVPGHQKLFFHGESILYPIEKGIGIIERNRLTKILTTKEDGLDIDQETVGTNDNSPVEITAFTSILFQAPDRIVITPIQTQLQVSSVRFKALLQLSAEEPDLLAMGSELASELFQSSSNAVLSFGRGLGGWLGVVDEPSANVQKAIKKMSASITEQLSAISQSLRETSQGAESLIGKAREMSVILKERLHKETEVRSVIPKIMAELLDTIGSLDDIREQYQSQLGDSVNKESAWDKEKQAFIEKVRMTSEEIDKHLTRLSEELSAIQKVYSELNQETQLSMKKDVATACKEIEEKSLSLIAYKKRLSEQLDKLPEPTDVMDYIAQYKRTILDKLTQLETYAEKLSVSEQWLTRAKQGCGLEEVLILSMRLHECGLLLQQDKSVLKEACAEGNQLTRRFERLMKSLQTVDAMADLEKKQAELSRLQTEAKALQTTAMRALEQIHFMHTHIMEMGKPLETLEKTHEVLEGDIAKIKSVLTPPDVNFSLIDNKRALKQLMSFPEVMPPQHSSKPSALLASMIARKEAEKEDKSQPPSRHEI